MIDWSSAFPRQDHTLGANSFVKNGVRGSLIPILICFFQERKMTVKFHGVTSEWRSLNGGGPQGATFGILEYLSQSNDNANCVSEKDRFKFIDDLSILEIVNLLTIGISCYNVKSHIPSNIGIHNQFIPASNLKSQKYLNQISEWTDNQLMKINESKIKMMIFNFTTNFKFSTDLVLNNVNVDETE